MSNQTHWKKLKNPDYLGAYELESGKDVIVTIKKVEQKAVKGTDGTEKECIVMSFVEAIKPMIVNSTNAKSIQKLLKSPYIEEWCGHKIQLYIKKEKIFGDMDDVLRVRPFKPESAAPSTQPKPAPAAPIICSDCTGEIMAVGGNSAAKIAAHTTEKFKRPLCYACAEKAAAANSEPAEPSVTEGTANAD